jgi:hypothetical protein
MGTSLKPGAVWSSPRRFATLTFLVTGFFATEVGFRFIGGYLYLVYMYGFSRVHNEHLHLLKMGKVDPWIVSNGDKIPGGGFPWFLVAAATSFAFFVPTFLLVYRLLPVRKDEK